MLDELLFGFAPRPRTLDVERPQVIRVHADDTGDQWYLTMGPEDSTTSREGDDADLTLTAPAADLYVRLWNRTPPSSIAMSGNAELLDLWTSNFRVRWG
jgi:hypothetical protein